MQASKGRNQSTVLSISDIYELQQKQTGQKNHKGVRSATHVLVVTIMCLIGNKAQSTGWESSLVLET